MLVFSARSCFSFVRGSDGNDQQVSGVGLGRVDRGDIATEYDLLPGHRPFVQLGERDRPEGNKPQVFHP